MRIAAAIVTIVAALGASCGDGDQTTSSPVSTRRPSADHSSGGLAYFTPTVLPSGLRVEYALLQRTDTESASWSAVLGRGGPERWTDLIRIFVSDESETADHCNSDDDGVRYVDVNGHRARMSVSELTGTSLSCFGPDNSVAVIGPSNREDDVIAVARRLRFADTMAGTKIDDAPAGYAIIERSFSPARPRSRYTINCVSDSQASARVFVTEVDPESTALAGLTAGQQSLERRTVRGKPAYAAVSRTKIREGFVFEHVSVTWLERTGLIATVSGVVPLDDALALAEGLRQRSEQEWRNELPVREGAKGEPPGPMEPSGPSASTSVPYAPGPTIP